MQLTIIFNMDSFADYFAYKNFGLWNTGKYWKVQLKFSQDQSQDTQFLFVWGKLKTENSWCFLNEKLIKYVEYMKILTWLML